jgi:ABC-2 type transport system permease protein
MSLASLFKSGVFLDLYFVKNNRANLISFLLWPYLMLILMLGAGLLFGSTQSFRSNVGDVDPIVFFVSSTLIASASLSVMWDVGGAVLFHRWAGTLPYVLLAPYRTSIILVMAYIPRYILWSFIQLAEFLPPLIIRKGIYALIIDLPILSISLIVGMLPLLGFSAIFASILLITKEESNILSWLNPIILILSGAFYPSYLFPLWAKIISQALPTTHTFELARLSALMSTPGAREVILIIGILLGMSVLYNALSYAMLGKAEERALGSGSI